MLLLWLLCVLTTIAKASNSSFSAEEGYEEKKRDDSVDDFQIYELIDTMHALTPHRTFYELLDVNPSSSDDLVSKKFRALSREWHPDKNPSEHAQKMYTLFTAVSAILRNEVSRRRYEWILNDAPPWHRSSTYLARKFVATSKMSLWQVSLFALCLVLVAQLIAQWTAYATACYNWWRANRATREMSAKERKRYQKRLADPGTDLAFLAYSNTSYQNLLEAQRPLPAAPRILDLFVFALPMAAFKRIFHRKQD